MSQDIKSLTTDQLVTLLYLSQVERRNEQKRLDLMEQQEKTMKVELDKRGLASGTYGGVNVTVTKTDEPFGADWAKIIQYIKDTGSVDLLEKRLLKSGVKKRWEDGESIPGVSKVEKVSITIGD